MPAASIHRLIRTLVTLGYVRQEPSRRYGLAVGLIRLGDGAAKRLGTWARPVLAGLVEKIGETANLAILEGSHALYVAQAPGAACNADVHRGRSPSPSSLHRRG